jgi:hypothetical protein
MVGIKSSTWKIHNSAVVYVIELLRRNLKDYGARLKLLVLEAGILHLSNNTDWGTNPC